MPKQLPFRQLQPIGLFHYFNPRLFHLLVPNIWI
jgi:hypothetical protein